MKISVLLVEDDPDLGSLLAMYLRANGMDAQLAADAQAARQQLLSNRFDIVVLDVNMPDQDGFELAVGLKKSYPGLPFLFLTARRLKEDVIKGLSLGAEDYILKPFDADELMLRITNILRRNVREKGMPAAYRLGIYLFEPGNLLLSSPNGNKMLTTKEAKLLEYLYRNRNNLVSREDLLAYVWQEVNFFNGRSMDVFISRLRKYLAEDTALQIESVRGVGFILRVI